MIKNITRFILSATLMVMASFAFAQSAAIDLGMKDFDKSQSVEVTANTLSVNQADGTAIFEGNVLVVQGEVRMSAGSVRVEYGQAEGSASGISRLVASGGVTFVTATDAVEAQEAVFSVDAGTVLLSGDVLLTQGPNAISGDTLTVDLQTGSGTMEGRVRTVFNTGGGN